MGIIGRKSEQRDFLEWMASDEAELICVYGRRRVGKTYFVNELLNGYYAFDTSAQDKSSEAVRLRIFHAARLIEIAAESGNDISFSEVAFECGFGNIRSFNRGFKMITDETPSKYLSNHRKHTKQQRSSN
jgi:AAA+ ATPase superfamily predicted ATPase